MFKVTQKVKLVAKPGPELAFVAPSSALVLPYCSLGNPLGTEAEAEPSKPPSQTCPALPACVPVMAARGRWPGCGGENSEEYGQHSASFLAHPIVRMPTYLKLGKLTH